MRDNAERNIVTHKHGKLEQRTGSQSVRTAESSFDGQWSRMESPRCAKQQHSEVLRRSEERRKGKAWDAMQWQGTARRGSDEQKHRMAKIRQA